jgi:hypothetical protein
MNKSHPPARLERVAVVVQHAEIFADEANDARLFDVADRLRLSAARLAIELEEAEGRIDAVARARAHRRDALARLRRACGRLDAEIEAKLPTEAAATLIAWARVSAESTMRFRLKRLGADERAVLGAVVDDCETALRAAEAAEDAALDATASSFVARVRAMGHAHALRRELERDKALLLTVLSPTSPAAARVRRRVVRTRRTERFADLVGSGAS